MALKTVLLVTPVFYAYHSALASAIEANGYRVVTHLYDGKAGLAGKLENRLIYVDRFGLRESVRKIVTARAIEALTETAPDLVVVVKGDVLTEDWWSKLAETRIPNVLWIYDELKNTSYEPRMLSELSSVVSYSRTDAATLNSLGIQTEYVPGGFDSLGPVTPTRGLESTVAFIGARYGEREALLTSLAQGGAKVKAFGRQWGSSLWDKARTGYWSAVPFEVGADLSRPMSYGVMQNALASVNHHGTHTGFNMRMFEACGVGGIHLVDRADVSEFYEPESEVLVFTDAGAALEQINRLKADPSAFGKMRERAMARTISDHTLTGRMKALLGYAK